MYLLVVDAKRNLFVILFISYEEMREILDLLDFSFVFCINIQYFYINCI